MMHLCFADYIPELMDSHSLYPQALPTRINPEGYGRNMSLFLVMKRYNYFILTFKQVLNNIGVTLCFRYDMSLKQYLSKTNPKIRDKILLLTQLLEAVTHMSNQNVAHRYTYI